MIAGVWLATHIPVHAGVHEAFRQHGAEQEVIQSQAGISCPAIALVVLEVITGPSTAAILL
jgi:hypothetical protein